MSFHNVGFYEDLTKIIFQLSSNRQIRTLSLLESLTISGSVISFQVEGKGNGIKTVIVNMPDIAKAISRPPTCKFTRYPLSVSA